jgi:hypothetical protein
MLDACLQGLDIALCSFGKGVVDFGFDSFDDIAK